MQTYIVCASLLLTLLVLVRAELLVVSVVADGALQPTPELNNIAEGLSQTLDFRFISCPDNSTASRNLRLQLIEGSETNLDYPDFIYNVPCRDNETSQLGSNATIDAENLGFVTLQISDEETEDIYMDYPLGITRPPLQLKDQIYIYGLMVLVATITFTFGISLDLEKVKQHLRRPIAPAIGMCCQFILMPVIGFLITLGMTTHDSLKLGVFAAAVAPGGGLSNIWIFVLDGDLDLSITMTFISTIAAIAFVPLWMYTLGQYIIGGAITLPFTNMAQTLALIVIPVTIGILVKRFLPKVAKILLYFQKPVVLVVILFAGGMGIWSNLYAFKMVLTDLQLSLCTCLLPYVGGLLGFLIALAFQQGRKIAVTIGIETAIQNTQIAIILLRTSLPQPWGDMSSSIPIVTIVFTFTPFLVFVFAQQIYLRCIKKKEEEDEEEEEDPKEMDSNKSNSLKLSEKAGVDNPTMTKDDIV